MKERDTLLIKYSGDVKELEKYGLSEMVVGRMGEYIPYYLKDNPQKKDIIVIPTAQLLHDAYYPVGVAGILQSIKTESEEQTNILDEVFHQFVSTKFAEGAEELSDDSYNVEFYEAMAEYNQKHEEVHQEDNILLKEDELDELIQKLEDIGDKIRAGKDEKAIELFEEVYFRVYYRNMMRYIFEELRADAEALQRMDQKYACSVLFDQVLLSILDDDTEGSKFDDVFARIAFSVDQIERLGYGRALSRIAIYGLISRDPEQIPGLSESKGFHKLFKKAFEDFVEGGATISKSDLKKISELALEYIQNYAASTRNLIEKYLAGEEIGEED